jgi:hypothetical protein
VTTFLEFVHCADGILDDEDLMEYAKIIIDEVVVQTISKLRG